MAVLPNYNQEDEDNQNPQAPVTPISGAIQQQGSPFSQSKSGASSKFQTLQKFVEANKPGNYSQKVVGALGRQAQNIGNLASEAKKQSSGEMQRLGQAQNLMGQVESNQQLSSDQIAQFRQLRRGEYQKDFNINQLPQIINRVKDFQNLAGGVGSETGRAQLLQSAFGNRPAYNQRMATLDQMLLQRRPEELATLKQQVAGVGQQAGQSLDQVRQAQENIRTNIKSLGEQYKGETQTLLGAEKQELFNPLEQRAKTLQDELRAKQQDVQKTLSQGYNILDDEGKLLQLTEPDLKKQFQGYYNLVRADQLTKRAQEMAKLGIDPKTFKEREFDAGKMGLDLNPYLKLTRPEDIKAESLASESDVARSKLLADLEEGSSRFNQVGRGPISFEEAIKGDPNQMINAMKSYLFKSSGGGAGLEGMGDVDESSDVENRRRIVQHLSSNLFKRYGPGGLEKGLYNSDGDLGALVSSLSGRDLLDDAQAQTFRDLGIDEKYLKQAEAAEDLAYAPIDDFSATTQSAKSGNLSASDFQMGQKRTSAINKMGTAMGWSPEETSKFQEFASKASIPADKIDNMMGVVGEETPNPNADIQRNNRIKDALKNRDFETAYKEANPKDVLDEKGQFIEQKTGVSKEQIDEDRKKGNVNLNYIENKKVRDDSVNKTSKAMGLSDEDTAKVRELADRLGMPADAFDESLNRAEDANASLRKGDVQGAYKSISPESMTESNLNRMGVSNEKSKEISGMVGSQTADIERDMRIKEALKKGDFKAALNEANPKDIADQKSNVNLNPVENKRIRDESVNKFGKTMGWSPEQTKKVQEIADRLGMPADEFDDILNKTEQVHASLKKGDIQGAYSTIDPRATTKSKLSKLGVSDEKSEQISNIVGNQFSDVERSMRVNEALKKGDFKTARKEADPMSVFKDQLTKLDVLKGPEDDVAKKLAEKSGMSEEEVKKNPHLATAKVINNKYDLGLSDQQMQMLSTAVNPGGAIKSAADEQARNPFTSPKDKANQIEQMEKQYQQMDLEAVAAASDTSNVVMKQLAKAGITGEAAEKIAAGVNPAGAIAQKVAQREEVKKAAEAASRAASAARSVGSSARSVARRFCFDPNTPILMADYKMKPIKDIKIGDKVFGGQVYAMNKSKPDPKDVYNYLGVIVTGSHPVFEQGKWKLVKDTNFAKPSKSIPKEVISISTTNHRMVANGLLFSDYDEVDSTPTNYHGNHIQELNEDKSKDALRKNALDKLYRS